MKHHFLVYTILVLAIFFIPISCTRDSIEPLTADCDETITYEMHIKPLINNTCAYAGCHNGTAPGDFSTYNGIKPVTENGKFRKNVIIDQVMPPQDATEGPNSLTEAQLILMLCWSEQGYLEK